MTPAVVDYHCGDGPRCGVRVGLEIVDLHPGSAAEEVAMAHLGGRVPTVDGARITDADADALLMTAFAGGVRRSVHGVDIAAGTHRRQPRASRRDAGRRTVAEWIDGAHCSHYHVHDVARTANAVVGPEGRWYPVTATAPASVRWADDAAEDYTPGQGWAAA